MFSVDITYSFLCLVCTKRIQQVHTIVLGLTTLINNCSIRLLLVFFFVIVVYVCVVGTEAIGAIRQKLHLCTGTINLSLSRVHKYKRAIEHVICNNNAIAATTSTNWRLNNVFHSIELSTKHSIWSFVQFLFCVDSRAPKDNEKKKRKERRRKKRKCDTIEMNFIHLMSFTLQCFICSHGYESAMQ